MQRNLKLDWVIFQENDTRTRITQEIEGMVVHTCRVSTWELRSKRPRDLRFAAERDKLGVTQPSGGDSGRWAARSVLRLQQLNSFCP